MINDNIYSQKLKLKKDILFYNSVSNDEQIGVLYSPTSGDYFSINAVEFKVAASISSKTKTITELVDNINLDKQQILDIIKMFDSYNLLITKNSITLKKNKFIFISNLIFFKLPIPGLNKIINTTSDLIFILFHKYIIFLFSISACLGYFMLFSLQVSQELLNVDLRSMQSLISIFCALIFIKLIHELAHIYTSKKIGINIREGGLVFILGFPKLYSDVTDLWKIESRKKRIIISFAGIASELIISGNAIILWFFFNEYDLFRTLLFYIFSISLFNTLTFNANPLMRFDGYYILCDILKIDNLRNKSIKVKFKEIVKSPFLWCFGKLSLSYQLFIFFSIIFFFTGKNYKLTYIICGGVCLIKLYLKMKKHILYFFALLTVFAILIFYPFDVWLTLKGQIIPKHKLMIYAPMDGYLTGLFDNKNGYEVKKGFLIGEIYNNQILLNKKIALLEKTRIEKQIKHISLMQNDLKNKELLIKNKIDIVKKLEAINNKLKKNKIKASFSGLFLPLIENKIVAEGENIGELVSKKMKAYVNLEEEYIERKSNNCIISIDNLELTGNLIDYQLINKNDKVSYRYNINIKNFNYKYLLNRKCNIKIKYKTSFIEYLFHKVKL